MIPTIKSVLNGTLLALVFGLSASVGTANQDQKHDEQLFEKLAAAAQDFKQKNGLSDEQFARLAGDWVMNFPGWRQGGVGLIAQDEYIVLDGERNELILPGGKKWLGRKSSDLEVVLTDGLRVIGSVPVSEEEASHLIIILFSPASARTINLAHNNGARYKRFKPSDQRP
ncbi:MAG TPA: hypothetical protein VJX29_09930 [Candidatus Acidoferrales bacterium]|nr:hypothetical protein [Candidatus Acidoferrales bacterium]